MPDALIWGASGGIGRALVDELKSRGWQVFAAARDEKGVPNSADLALSFDATDSDSVTQAVFRVAQETDGLDLIVYAAGDVAFDKIGDMSPEAWLATIDANLTGAFYTAHEGLDLLSKGGSMVFIGAYADHLRIPRMGAYAAAKAALQEFVTVLAKENRHHRFVVVRPGAVDTAFWDKVTLKKPADIKAPAVVARAIVEHHEQQTDGDLNL